MSADRPRVIGVVGAGTMGAGIAQLGGAGGCADAAATTRTRRRWSAACTRVRAGIGSGVEKGRARGGAADGCPPEAVASLDDLAGCELVIEAAPERLELKHELFARRSRRSPRTRVLASNTSSIPITAIAAASPDPSSASSACTSSTRRR